MDSSVSNLPGVSRFMRLGDRLRLESDLPIALRALASELSLGSPFELAIERIASANYSVSPEFAKVSMEVRAGASLKESMKNMAARTDSILFKRAIMQLIFSYESGSDVQSVLRLAQELIEQQKARTREHSAKMIFASILVISSSCILPSLFILYILVGSSFLFLPIDSNGVLLAYLLGFPVLNSVLLLWVSLTTPPSAGIKKHRLLYDETTVDKLIASLGLPMSSRSLLTVSALLSVSLSLLLFVVWGAVLPSLLPLWLPFAMYAFFSYSSTARTSAIEKFLPDALFLASSFQKGTSTERIVSSIVDSGYGPLSEEFEMARSQIKSGEDPARAIEAIGSRNDSVILSRATGLIAQGYRTGADVHVAMRETADDIFNVFSLIRERSSQLALQKYTLIFGGTFLVPLIIGSVASLSMQMDFSGLAELVGSGQNEELLGTAIFSSQIYLVSYSIMASIFISLQEHNVSRAPFYLVFTAPTALLVFHLAMSLDVISLIS